MAEQGKTMFAQFRDRNRELCSVCYCMYDTQSENALITKLAKEALPKEYFGNCTDMSITGTHHGAALFLRNILCNGKILFSKETLPHDIISHILSTMNLGAMKMPRTIVKKLYTSIFNLYQFIQFSEDINYEEKETNYTPETNIDIESFSLNGTKFIPDSDELTYCKIMKYRLLNKYHRAATFFINSLYRNRDALYLNSTKRLNAPPESLCLDPEQFTPENIPYFVYGFKITNSLIMRHIEKSRKYKFCAFDLEKAYDNTPFNIWNNGPDRRCCTQQEIMVLLDEEKLIYKIIPRSLHQFDRAIVHLFFTDVDNVFKNPEIGENCSPLKYYIRELKNMRIRALEGMEWFFGKCEEELNNSLEKTNSLIRKSEELLKKSKNAQAPIEEIEHNLQDLLKAQKLIEGTLQMICGLQESLNSYKAIFTEDLIFGKTMEIVNGPIEGSTSPQVAKAQAEKFEAQVNQLLDAHYYDSMERTVRRYILEHATQPSVLEKAREENPKHHKKYTLLRLFPGLPQPGREDILDDDDQRLINAKKILDQFIEKKNNAAQPLEEHIKVDAPSTQANQPLEEHIDVDEPSTQTSQPLAAQPTKQESITTKTNNIS